jgi:hypothetical protein
LVAKNVTKVRTEQREKHANPHFRHGQVYHNSAGANRKLACVDLDITETANNGTKTLKRSVFQVRVDLRI